MGRLREVRVSSCPCDLSQGRSLPVLELLVHIRAKHARSKNSLR
jgi:hypothetical protein